MICPLESQLLVQMDLQSHTKSNNSIKHNKAWLVAMDFTQEYDIDYEKTLVLVARITSSQLTGSSHY